MNAVPLPPDLVQRFNNKVIAIVGYEADQVFVTPNGDVSVPIYWYALKITVPKVHISP